MSARAPKTARGKWAAEAVEQVRDDALRYLGHSPHGSRLQARHIVRWDRHKHRLADVARLMNPRRLAFHEVRLHYVVAVLETLCELAGKASAYYGRVEPMVAFTTPLLASWARKQFPMSVRTVRRALCVLAESELILYDPGRSRHPSLAGFPLMVDVDETAKSRATLAAYEHDRPAWWTPMRLALELELEPDARAHALGDLRSELERIRADDIEAQRAAIAEHTADKPFVLGAIDVARARARAAQRERRCAQQLARPTPDKPRPNAPQALVSHGQNGRSCPRPEIAPRDVVNNEVPIWPAVPTGREGQDDSQKTVAARWDVPAGLDLRTMPSTFAEGMAAASHAHAEEPRERDSESGRASDDERAGMQLSSGPDGGCLGRGTERLPSVALGKCQPPPAGSFSRCGEIWRLVKAEAAKVRKPREGRLTADSRRPSLRVVRSEDEPPPS